MSELIIESLKESIGKRVGFFLENGYYYEGIILDCDGTILKYNDRKVGVKLIEVSRIKEVSMK